LKQRLSSGEVSCIAFARKTDWHVATDDKRACEIAETILGDGRLLTTPGLILTAIRTGLLTVEEADSIRTKLMESRFRMSFGSFREVL
jgi:predicted nucleic acid-binding protein